MKIWNDSLRKLVRGVAYESGKAMVFLSSFDGVRRSLSWVQDAFFLGMVDELEAQTVPRKVAADILGMNLRTYQRRIAQAAQSSHASYNLWQSIHVRLGGEPATKSTILSWFPQSHHASVASILRDMLDHGWVKMLDGQTFTAISASVTWTDEMLDEYVFWEQGISGTQDTATWEARTGVPQSRWKEALVRHANYEVEHVASQNRRSTELLNRVFLTMMRQLMGLMRRTDDTSLYGLGMVSVDKLSEEDILELRRKVKVIQKQCIDLGFEYPKDNREIPASLDLGANGEQRIWSFMYGTLAGDEID